MGERSRTIRGPWCARRFESLGKQNPAKGEGRISIVSRGAEPEAPVSAPRRPPTSFPLFCCSVPGKSGEVATRCPQRVPAFVHSGQRSLAAGPRRFLRTRACLWANGRQKFIFIPPRLAIRRVLCLFACRKFSTSPITGRHSKPALRSYPCRESGGASLGYIPFFSLWRVCSCKS